MGAVTGFLGLGGGQNGTGVDGPQSANLANPVDQGQINQSYNQVQGSLAGQQALLQALQAQGGLGNQSQVYQQLQGVAGGAGPNPAQAQFQQNINQLAAQQAGALAGVKGLSPATAARMIAMQAGSAGQNAAAAAAANQAQQQLGALQAAGAMANQQAANQIGATNAFTEANLANQNQLLNSVAQTNNALVNNQSSMNTSNAALAGQMIGAQKGFIGGGLNAAGMAVSPKSAFSQAGGTFANGGMVEPKSAFGRHLMAKGGEVPALVSPGEVYVPPHVVQQYAQGDVDAGEMLKKGERIPGVAPVKGDSYANDVVPKNLAPGGVVIPRSATQTKNPERSAADFVAAVLAKKGVRK